MKSKVALFISLLVLIGLLAFFWTDGFKSPVARIQQVSDIVLPPTPQM